MIILCQLTNIYLFIGFEKCPPKIVSCDEIQVPFHEMNLSQQCCGLKPHGGDAQLSPCHFSSPAPAPPLTICCILKSQSAHWHFSYPTSCPLPSVQSQC